MKISLFHRFQILTTMDISIGNVKFWKSKLHIYIYLFIFLRQNYSFLSVARVFNRVFTPIRKYREKMLRFIFSMERYIRRNGKWVARCTHRQQGERSLKRFSLCKLNCIVVRCAQAIVFVCCIILTIETAPYQLSRTIFTYLGIVPRIFPLLTCVCTVIGNSHGISQNYRIF